LADHFTIEIEGGMVAALEFQGVVFSAKTFLGTTYRGDLQTQTQVTGQTQLTWVG